MIVRIDGSKWKKNCRKAVLFLHFGRSEKFSDFRIGQESERRDVTEEMKGSAEWGNRQRGGEVWTEEKS